MRRAAQHAVVALLGLAVGTALTATPAASQQGEEEVTTTISIESYAPIAVVDPTCTGVRGYQGDVLTCDLEALDANGEPTLATYEAVSTDTTVATVEVVGQDGDFRLVITLVGTGQVDIIAKAHPVLTMIGILYDDGAFETATLRADGTKHLPTLVQGERGQLCLFELWGGEITRKSHPLCPGKDLPVIGGQPTPAQGQS